MKAAPRKSTTGYTMQVDFSGHLVRCETDGRLVCLNDLIFAGNKWRYSQDLKPMTVAQLTSSSAAFDDFLKAAAKGYNVPAESLIKVIGKGNQSRTMVHVVLAIFVAERMSPEFHFNVIRTFVEGKLMEFRELGGTEFKNLNAAIDLHLPGAEGQNNLGKYINAAKLIRAKILGPDAEAGAWDTATVAQTHARYDAETFLVRLLRRNKIKDWEDLKNEIINL